MPRSSRWTELRDAVSSIGGCLCPWLRKFKVSYFKRVPSATAGMTDSEWKQIEVMAYNREDAAARVTESEGLDRKLRAGYNCFVSRVIGG